MNRRERHLLTLGIRAARAEVNGSGEWSPPLDPDQVIDLTVEHIADELASTSGFDRTRFIEATR